VRIHVHDFSGHPFQVELSRALAHRDHEVRHTYSSEYVTGHGRLSVEPGDPDTFSVGAVSTGLSFDKYRAAARLRFEVAYGRSLIREIEQHGPDVALICNVPLLAMTRVARHLRRRVPLVFWHQDVYSLAMSDAVNQALPKALARPASRLLQGAERRVLRSSRAVVAIADTFQEQYDDWGLALPDVSVIPNWAPVSEITPRERENPWASHWPSQVATRVLYAGTLGRKHNPLLLLDLLRALRDRGVDAGLVVVSEGPGADAVASAAGEDPTVRVLPFQPAESLPDVLGSGDVLLALLEPDASRFSVPSKVASYLAAGRPVVLLGPATNPVAADVQRAGGVVAAPDREGAEAAADWVAKTVADPQRAQEAGRSARAFAEQRYEISQVVKVFETVLARATNTSN
jgi:colanic acid biosynthesis glycosyl transferase WcaI